MRLDPGMRLTFAGLAVSTLLFLTGLASPPLHAEDTPSATPPSATPAPPTGKPDVAAPEKPGEPETTMPGVPNDAAAEPTEIPARPTAFLHGQAKWSDGFASLMSAQAKVKDAVAKAGLKQSGQPMTVFTETDDSGFSYDAMLPLADKPSDNVKLDDDVKLGLSPSGKAIKFEHRGSYDDIDGTYELITAYLDEKGLESRNFFIEEYLTDLKTSDDPNLSVDIYVFVK